MKTASSEPTGLRSALRAYQRSAAKWSGGMGLWMVIGAFMLWAVVQERDAFTVGLVVGSIFALGAIGLTLVYGVLKFGHFAHGDVMMFSAYLAFLLLFGFIVGDRPGDRLEILPFTVNDLPGADDRIWKFSFGYALLIAIVLAAAMTAGILVLLDRVVYQPLRRRRSSIVIFSIASLGLALAIRSLILLLWGPTPRLYSPGIRQRLDLPFSIELLADQTFIIATAVIVTIAVYFLLFRTKLGKAMRAMADNPDLARISGINTDQITIWLWVVSGALVSIAGVLLALQAQLDPELGFLLLLPLFASAILGGLGQPHGALLGGIIVGVTQEVGTTLDLPVLGAIDPQYKFSIAFIILITILLFRPTGLFGAKV